MTANDLLRKINEAMTAEDVVNAVFLWSAAGRQGIIVEQGNGWLCGCDDGADSNPSWSPECDQCGWTRPTS